MNILYLPDDILEIIENKLEELKEVDEDFKKADEGIEYLKSTKQYNEEEVNEILYDRLYKIGYSWYNIDKYKKLRNIYF
jgi:hypothetical protein